ncbi:hypothetical protein OSH10_22120 [Kaistia defluvii]|uniref:hypothetical protein n=1 Tax=Kaistia defluvii TaxID=410841 RepID=UPI00224E4B1E|nr:hypothetical protein [Kaistia defluvii]MCX5521144.1 hypothetical protein [Kaistia defluvii]
MRVKFPAFKPLKLVLSAAVLAGTAGIGLLLAATTPSEAVVYCKRVGYPVGCVVRPAPVVRPGTVVYCQNGVYVKGCVARPAPRVVYCKRVGYPKGCVMR